MAYVVKDMDLWDELKEDLKSEKNAHQSDIPKRLRVISVGPTSQTNCLDLHGLTVQEAYEKTIRFLLSHVRLKTKEVLVITGKGTTGKGLIKKEFVNWLESSKLKKYVFSYQWKNDGGAVKINLKK